MITKQYINTTYTNLSCWHQCLYGFCVGRNQSNQGKLTLSNLVTKWPSQMPRPCYRTFKWQQWEVKPEYQTLVAAVRYETRVSNLGGSSERPNPGIKPWWQQWEVKPGYRTFVAAILTLDLNHFNKSHRQDKLYTGTQTHYKSHENLHKVQ